MNEVLKVISKEIKFYKEKFNKNWSKDKNEGFKEGLKYCKQIVETIKKTSY